MCAAAGDMHSAVTTASGCVYTWGFGATGALGHGGSEGGGLGNQTIPKRVDAFLTHFEDFVEVRSRQTLRRKQRRRAMIAFHAARPCKAWGLHGP